MARELQPTLCRTAVISALGTGTGSVASMGFDFGIQQGARLIKVEYQLTITAGTHVGAAMGLYLGPTRANPASAGELPYDEDVVGGAFYHIQQEAAGEQHVPLLINDLSMTTIFITRNILFCMFNSGASNIIGTCKLYYNRVEYTAEEAIVVMTLRR